MIIHIQFMDYFINYNFFSISADINYKKVFSVIISLFKRKRCGKYRADFSKINIEDQPQTLEKPDVTFSTTPTHKFSDRAKLLPEN